MLIDNRGGDDSVCLFVLLNLNDEKKDKMSPEAFHDS
jgi:hypothetical protein